MTHGRTLIHFLGSLALGCGVSVGGPGIASATSEEAAAKSVRGHAPTPPRDDDPSPPLPPDFDPGLLPAVVAVVPGLLVHGAGHAAAGDWDTALTLLKLEGIGLATVFGAATWMALTGADRRTVGPAAMVALVGVDLFLVSAFADVVGAAAGDLLADRPTPLQRPPAHVSAGYRYVSDPIFAYRSLLVTRGRLHLGSLRLLPEVWAAADADNQRVRLVFSHGVWTPRGEGGVACGDDTALRIDAGATHHRYGDDGFSITTVEAQVGGRYDLGRLARSLRAAFAEMSLGVGVEAYDYAAPGLGFAQDVRTLLLSRMVFGVRFGASGGDRIGTGTLKLLYDHRKDGYAAGLSLGNGGGGFMGHVGVEATVRVSQQIAIRAELMAGAAYVGGVDVVYEVAP